jgi:pilus assembly protein CpaE
VQAGDDSPNPGLPQYGQAPEPLLDPGAMRAQDAIRAEEPPRGIRPYGAAPGNGRQELLGSSPVAGSEGTVSEKLAIAVIGPDNPRRAATIEAFSGNQGWEVQEVLPYPARLDDVPYLLVWNFDVMAVDLDSNRKFALDLVARICSECPATVMVYTSETDLELLVRCMWAGAREVLTFPLAPGVIPDAMARAASRRQTARPVHKALGKLLTFVGAKGGSGTTTVACNFAVSLAKESGQSTILIDLDLPLGDTAIHLGVTSEHSTMNALQNFNRLDWTLFSKLLTEHESGLMVLAAPGQYSNTEASDEAIQKLLAVARNHFDYVVVDAGSRPDQKTSTIFKYASTIFLVTQIDVTELRNANRIIARFFVECGSRLQIVVNRFTESVAGIKESDIATALTRPPDWKIPNEPVNVHRMKINADPMSAEKSPLVRIIHSMARNECGANVQGKKKRWFDLF